LLTRFLTHREKGVFPNTCKNCSRIFEAERSHSRFCSATCRGLYGRRLRARPPLRVLLVQLDGKLPNLALMRLSAWHKAQGHEVEFSRRIQRHQRGLLKPRYDRVYGSAIFAFSKERIAELREEYPDAIIGGTGVPGCRISVEDIIGADEDPTVLDYSLYPDFTGSLGFTQRGCRLKCKFCVVPAKEGANRSAATITEIWRGEPMPRHIHLLDNDFFGQPTGQWQARIAEIHNGGFKVCFNQGINIRMIGPRLDPEGAIAAALASVDYRDDGFVNKRIYTAWDNLGDERAFFEGVVRLEAAGIPPRHLMVYMLVGYDRRETWPRIFERFDKMTARGIKPYPMVYDIRDRDLEHWRRLKQFQRWAVWRLYQWLPWQDYRGKYVVPAAHGAPLPLQ
jgi:hypothetical protein